MASRVVFREPQMTNMLDNPSGDVGKYMANRGRLLVGMAKRQVGVKTGALRASINMTHSRTGRGQQIRIGSSLPYARLHHEGSPPHLIRPKNARMLRFYSRGQIVFTHMVRHPGTRPNRYLTDNMRRAFR
jgi:hypothetical protein